MSLIGNISLMLLSLNPLPTVAQITTSQTDRIEATVGGENNQVYQTIHQTIINHPRKVSIQRSSGNPQKRPEKSSRYSSHQQSEKIPHLRRNHY